MSEPNLLVYLVPIQLPTTYTGNNRAAHATPLLVKQENATFHKLIMAQVGLMYLSVMVGCGAHDSNCIRMLL